MINPLKNNYLLRTAWIVWATAMLACGGRRHTQEATPPPTAPLPTAGLAGQRVSVLPITLVAAEESLHWERFLANRGATLAQADSVIGTLLMARTPEVTWVLPDELRRAARRAPGIAPVPDQMGTAVLRSESIQLVPDPLRSELRTLVALAGSGGGGGGGGRYALVPAALVFRRSGGQAVGRSGVGAQHPAPPPAAGPPDRMTATAELSVVMVDVRTGRIGFRTVARGDGDDPWTALTGAVKSLTPGLP